MPAPYNLTNITAEPGFDGLISGLNAASGGLFGLSTWLSVFLIAFFGLLVNGYGARESFASGSFVSFLFGLLLWSQGWLTDWVLVLNVVMLLGSFLLLQFRR